MFDSAFEHNTKSFKFLWVEESRVNAIYHSVDSLATKRNSRLSDAKDFLVLFQEPKFQCLASFAKGFFVHGDVLHLDQTI